MANITYNYGRAKTLDRTLDLTSTTNIKTMLVASGYTADKDHQFVASPGPAAGELANGTGYASGWAGAGRKALSSITITTDTTNDWAKYTAANLTWTAINDGTPNAIVVWYSITNDAGSYPVVYIDGGWGGGVPTNGGDLNVNWGSNGIFTWS